MARRPTREIIADFIKQNPDVSMDEIFDAMFLDSTHLHAYIHELIDLGIVERRRTGRGYRYSIADGVDIESIYTDPHIQRDRDAAMQAEHLAQQLIERGLLRRAATVLTDAMGLLATASEVHRIARLRHKCLMQARREGADWRQSCGSEF